MKKFFTLLMVAAILAPLSANSAVVGDINGDAAVNLTDAILALQIVVGLTPTVPVVIAAEVNSDQKIGLAEVISYGGSGHPVLIPSICPNLNGDGEIVSIDTKWYAVKNDNIEEIVDQDVLSRFIKSYGFQTSVKDPDNENYYFQGSIIGNTTVPWPILMQDVIDGSSGEYIKVNVGLYGSSFEFYFVESAETFLVKRVAHSGSYYYN